MPRSSPWVNPQSCPLNNGLQHSTGSYNFFPSVVGEVSKGVDEDGGGSFSGSLAELAKNATGRMQIQGSGKHRLRQIFPKLVTMFSTQRPMIQSTEFFKPLGWGSDVSGCLLVSLRDLIRMIY